MRTTITIATIICLASSVFAGTITVGAFMKPNCIGTSLFNLTIIENTCVGANETINNVTTTSYSKVVWGKNITILDDCAKSDCTNCVTNETFSNANDSNSICANDTDTDTSFKFSYSSASLIRTIVVAIFFLFFF